RRQDAGDDRRLPRRRRRGGDAGLFHLRRIGGRAGDDRPPGWRSPGTAALRRLPGGGRAGRAVRRNAAGRRLPRADAMTVRPARPRGGLRREGPIVLTVALAIFVLLSAFTLLAFRQAAARASAERRADVVALADRLARESSGGRIDPLARAAPPGAALALFAADGRLL